MTAGLKNGFPAQTARTAGIRSSSVALFNRYARAPAARDFLAGRPVEQRIERLPVLVKLQLQTRDLFISSDQRTLFRQRGNVRATELRQLVAVLRRAFAFHIEEVIAYEDAGQVNVGPRGSELRLDVAMVGIELIELGIDVLCLARRREHRQRDQHDQAAESQRRDQPGFQTACEPPSLGSVRAYVI